MSETANQVEEKVVSTHVLVPHEHSRQLRDLARYTRIHQSDYLREAVDDVLLKYRPEVRPAALALPPQTASSIRLESIVFRLSSKALEDLKTLARETRIRQSEYLREAVADLLRKHAAKLPETVPLSPLGGSPAVGAGAR